jgi:hypothetical protein
MIAHFSMNCLYNSNYLIQIMSTPSHQNIKQTEEQIRQRFRQQLQQRVPSLAQQLPVDSDRLSNDDGL